ncbi:MAG: molybdopterin-dependent oxidoreductase [Anaeromyxobacter sp.]|nr:molybdopterin-dependent oxidoreductase [Anaeromyxobacter sp.]MBL0274570.1 molybdopterin-dependent oxidoreductase [Anaeromyxobacter sp.]
MTVSRRNLLKGFAALGISGLASETAAAPAAQPAAPPVPPPAPTPGASTEAAWREEFARTYGDAEQHGYAYHCVNCQGNCAWEVWTDAGGRITRENQSASYPPVAADVPDANPRGCNKGAQHSQLVYQADRLMYPMRRAGARGEGKWKRISWDEAITEVATRLYQTMLEKGPAGNYVHMGSGMLSEARAASVKRLGTLLGAVRPYIASYVGDNFPGVSAVYGEGNLGCTYDFLYGADVAVFWGCNPNTSRIPDAHYLWEAKYRGAKIVVVTPEFNASAIHADLWVPVKPGGDGHLALAVMHRLLQRKLYPERFLKQFTDLTLLVRTDTRQLVRLHDVDLSDPRFDQASVERFAADHEKHHEVFLAWDLKQRKATALPGCEGSTVETLRLEDISWNLDPALSGRYRLKLKGHGEVEVAPAFSLFAKELGAYAAAKVQPITGVHPAVVDQLATLLGSSKVAVLTLGFAVGKHFNGMLSQRAISALAAFLGKLGPAGGLNTENEWSITGLEALSGFAGRYQHRFASGFVSEWMLGDGAADPSFDDADYRRATGTSRAAHQASVKAALDASEGDGPAKARQGKPWWKETETFLLFADARFRRNKGRYKQAFLEKAAFIAYGDTRMSDFATFADVLLPCTSAYEAWDLRTNPGYHRFANVCAPPANLKPVGEARSEWEISTLIAEKLQALAVARHQATGDQRSIRIPDPTHAQEGVRPLDKLVEEFTLGGKLRTDRDAVEFALEHVDQFKPSTPQSMVARGGFLVLNDLAGKTSPLYPDRPYSSFENNLYLSQRFETVSGRLTFYVDDPAWIAAGASLPAATLPIHPRRFPLLLMTPHARWSIHSTYKVSPTLLRLQRGEPCAMLNPATAKAKGIADGDRMRMWNDLGQAELLAKLSAGVPPGAVVLEHGWEPFQYRGKQGHNALVGDAINLLELSDGWGHLKFGASWDGNQHAYDATVDVAKVG